jgi:hypothetical protein
MKVFCVVVGAVVSLACGSRETPPASAPSSTGVEQATDNPNTGPDFSPSASDGTFNPPAADARAADAGPAAPTAGATGTWQSGTGGGGGGAATTP